MRRRVSSISAKFEMRQEASNLAEILLTCRLISILAEILLTCRLISNVAEILLTWR
jgi:hypothetical protein